MKFNNRFLFLLLLLTLKTTHRLATADPNDEACLTNLHKNLQDPSNNLHNWTKPTFSNPCSGFTSYLPGVTCNNGRIYKLSLTNLSLRGTISPFLSNCTNLQSLDLSSNQIPGEIPTELKLLVYLAIRNLSSNRLSGQIGINYEQYSSNLEGPQIGINYGRYGSNLPPLKTLPSLLNTLSIKHLKPFDLNPLS